VAHRLQHAQAEPTIQVLIAEDDPDIRAIVLTVVEGLGHAPSCAANGAEALELYNARGADVVVSDWMMPRMDAAVSERDSARHTPTSSC